MLSLSTALALALSLVARGSDAGGPGLDGPLDAGAPGAALVLRGNLVLPDEVYRTALGLEADAAPPLDAGAEAAARLTDFLRRSGYELAVVRARAEGGSLVLDIDEGRLERVVFRGPLTLPLVRFKLGLKLPAEVFNRPQLERELARLAREVGVPAPAWALVPSERVAYDGPQVTDLGPLGSVQGRSLLRPQEKYELHVTFRQEEWPPGPGLDVRLGYFDGLEVGGHLLVADALAPGGRARLAGSVGAGLRQDLALNRLYPFPSRAALEASWWAPPWGAGEALRARLALRAEGLARQRRDLRLENSFHTAAEAAAGLTLSTSPAWRLAVDVGIQHFFVFGLRAPDGEPAPAPLERPERLRAFVQLRADFSFSPQDTRLDRKHALSLEGRLFSGFARPGADVYAELRGAWQHVTAWGWNDVVTRVRATALAGDVLFPLEEPLGEYLRGVAADAFTHLAAGLRNELRLSLTRDVLKVGVFLDVATWAQLDRAGGPAIPRVGLAAGPTVHLLLEGMFQVNVAFSVAWLSQGRFDSGVWGALAKVF